MRKFTRHVLFLLDGCLAFGYEVVTLRDLRGVSFLGQLRDTHVFGDLPVDISYAREPILIRLVVLGGCVREVLVNV